MDYSRTTRRVFRRFIVIPYADSSHQRGLLQIHHYPVVAVGRKGHHPHVYVLSRVIHTVYELIKSAHIAATLAIEVTRHGIQLGWSQC